MAEIITMPRLSDTMTDGVVVKWHKKIGDKIQEGDLLADIETDKATMEFESFQEGYLLHIGIQENETAAVDSVLAILGEEGEDVSSLLDLKNIDNQNSDPLPNSVVEVPQKLEVPQKVDSFNTQNNTDRLIKISPLAKRIAKEKKLDITTIKGSGDGGRIIKRDVNNVTNTVTELGNVKSLLIDQDIPVSQMRKTIANRLSESKYSAPHFYLNIEVEMDPLIENRKLMNTKNEVKISFNDILVKAVAMAIRKHPNINSSWFGDHIKLHQEINIGVAVSVDNGLIVPVIKHADNKSFLEISHETTVFIQKAKDNKLQPSDWESNTFTISNLGMFGIDDFTAIINPPDACILAVGAIKERPVVKDGDIVKASIMRLTLSCDHRLVDGVVGSKFLNTLKNMMESPLMMFC